MLLANAPGMAILNGTVVAGTFIGPPLVVEADGLTSTDPRWLAANDFASALGAPVGQVAPLVGVPLGMAPDVFGDIDSATLLASLRALSQYFDVSALRPFVWCDTGKDTVIPVGESLGLDQWPLCGPIFSMPSSDGLRVSTLATCWLRSGSYARITSNSLYGVGSMACGSAIPDERASPPVYDCPPTGYVKFFNTLLNVWKRGGPVTLGNYATLQALESNPARLGISRRTHPALVPFIKLSF